MGIQRLYIMILLVLGGLVIPVSATESEYVDAWFGQDKALHFTLSAALSAGMYVGCRSGLHINQESSLLLTPMWVVTIGFAKEDHDLNIKGTGFSVRDIVADILGMGTGLVCAWAWDVAR